jgi:Domain of unknown function (DUF1735)
MKKILLSVIFLSALLTSCLKDTTINTDLDTRGTTMMIQYSGIEFFSSAAIVTAGKVDPIEASFTVNVANADGIPLPNDLTVTLAVDDAARVNYNALPAPALDYDAIPDSVYSFPVKTGVIKSGKNLLTLKVIFYPAKVDPSKSYMLAISIKDAQGKSIAKNFGTIYYHIIGNPLAGSYLWSYYRWNGTTDTTTAPNSTVVLNAPLAVLPLSPTAVFLQEYYIGVNFGNQFGTTLQFLAGATPTNFSTSFDAASLDVLTTNSFSTPTNGPKLVKAVVVGTSATNYKGTTFRTYTEFINSAGAVRALIDNYVKQ